MSEPPAVESDPVRRGPEGAAADRPAESPPPGPRDGEAWEVPPAAAESSEPAAEPQRHLGRIIGVCLAAWWVPGAGHLLVGRRSRAVGFAALIAALFFGGLALDGVLYRPLSGDPLSYLAALGGSGAGALYVVGQVLGWGAGVPSAPYYEYGNTFTLAAGLLNLLIVLDAFDFAVLGAGVAPSVSTADDPT